MVLVLALLGGLAVASPSSAAGFDCSKATAPDEVAVCRSPALSELDSEMTGLWYAFSRIPMLMGGSGERQTDADDFLANRRKCGGDTACLTKAYTDRIADLRRDIAGSMTAIQPFISGGGGNPQSSLPAAVAPALVDYGTQCGKVGGSLVNAEDVQVLAGDVDGDELFDYVVNPQALQCRGAATALCANNGCDIRLYLSRTQYTKPVSVRGGQPTLVQRGNRTDAEIWVDRTNCSAAPGGQCWAIYSWQNGALDTTYETRRNADGS
jgi:hypothetical protein